MLFLKCLKLSLGGMCRYSFVWHNHVLPSWTTNSKLYSGLKNIGSDWYIEPCTFHKQCKKKNGHKSWAHCHNICWVCKCAAVWNFPPTILIQCWLKKKKKITTWATLPLTVCWTQVCYTYHKTQNTTTTTTTTTYHTESTVVSAYDMSNGDAKWCIKVSHLVKSFFFLQ